MFQELIMKARRAICRGGKNINESECERRAVAPNWSATETQSGGAALKRCKELCSLSVSLGGCSKRTTTSCDFGLLLSG